MKQRQYTQSVDGVERCTVRLHVRLTREEIELLEGKCKKLGMSVVSYLESIADDEKDRVIESLKDDEPRAFT